MVDGPKNTKKRVKVVDDRDNGKDEEFDQDDFDDFDDIEDFDFDEEEYERYWKTKKGDKFPEPISFFHRTLSTYLNSLSNAGFRLLEFVEPKPIDEDQFFDRERRVPFFAVFKATRIE